MIERVKTGVPGLDELVGGGIPKGHLILVSGGPGAGKTVLSSQIVYTGATVYGEKGLYATFSESPKALKRNLMSFGWNLDELEKRGLVKIMGLPAIIGEAADLLGYLVDEAVEFGAQRLVVDSFTALVLSLGENVGDLRAFAHTLYRSIKRIGCPLSILVAETPYGQVGIGMGVEEFVVDGIMLLKMRANERRVHRSIMILKMRGTEHDLNCHPMIIDSQGVRIMPEIE